MRVRSVVIGVCVCVVLVSGVQECDLCGEAAVPDLVGLVRRSLQRPPEGRRVKSRALFTHRFLEMSAVTGSRRPGMRWTTFTTLRTGQLQYQTGSIMGWHLHLQQPALISQPWTWLHTLISWHECLMSPVMICTNMAVSVCVCVCVCVYGWMDGWYSLVRGGGGGRILVLG